MLPSLDVGLAGTAQTTVTEANTALALGSGQVPVYATPALVALLEQVVVDEHRFLARVQEKIRRST